MAVHDVHSKIVCFSQNTKFKAEKPYTTAFSVADQPGAIPSNHEFDPRDMIIHDVRKRGHFDLNTAGFQFMKHNISLTREDFDSNDTVEDRYYAEINSFTQKSLPRYSAIAFLEYEVCNLTQAFRSIHTTAVGRIESGASFFHMLQVTLPYVDHTSDHAVRRLEKALSSQYPELLEQPFEVLKQVHHAIERTRRRLIPFNIWRLLRGPNNDWPLALCDYRQVNPERDSLKNDILFREEAGENILLKYNDSHQCYYMSDQNVDDVIVFRNAETDSPNSARRLTVLVVLFSYSRFLFQSKSRKRPAVRS